MGRPSWLIFALLAALVGFTAFNHYIGGPRKEWLNCKESLVVQVFSGKCTKRRGYEDTTADLGGNQTLDQ